MLTHQPKLMNMLNYQLNINMLALLLVCMLTFPELLAPEAHLWSLDMCWLPLDDTPITVFQVNKINNGYRTMCSRVQGQLQLTLQAVLHFSRMISVNDFYHLQFQHCGWSAYIQRKAQICLVRSLYNSMLVDIQMNCWFVYVFKKCLNNGWISWMGVISHSFADCIMWVC